MLAVSEVFSVILYLYNIYLVSKTSETKILISPKMSCIVLKTKIDLNQTQYF